MQSNKIITVCLCAILGGIVVGGCSSSPNNGAVDTPLMKNAPPKPASLKGTPALAPQGAGGAPGASAASPN